MKIGQLERVSGTSRSTIRHYEALGLMPAFEVRGPKLHLYGAEHVTRLREIQRLRERGVPLREMKPLLSRVRARATPPTTVDGAHGTREQILGEAARRLLSVGYHGLKLETLARSLRIAKPTIYRHFSSKEQLFLAAVKQMRLSLVPQKLREQGAALEVDAQGRLRARVVLENFVGFRGLYTLLQTLTADGDTVVAEAARRELHSMVTNAEPFLQSCVAQGRFRAFDAGFLAYVLWGALMGAGEYMLNHPEINADAIDELVSKYLTVVEHGLLAQR